MTKSEYEAKRQNLIDDAQKLIDEGKVDEANKIMDQVESLKAEYEAAAKAQANLNALSTPKKSNFMKNAMEGANNAMSTPIVTKENIYGSVEYRTAFMKNVLAGEAIPAKFVNENANTKTGDVAVVIPTTTMQRIIEKLEEHGQIYALVTKTNYKGGVSVPTSTVKPVATWVAEGAGSDRQKKTTGTITFSYYKLRCSISISLEVETVTLDFFETVFVNQVAESMIAAIEKAIIKGTGSGQPKGILAETVADGQNVDVAKTGSITYKTLWEIKKKVPSGYRNAVKWFMNYSTFCDIMALTDNAGQPIARINYGLDGGSQAAILGTPVVFSDEIDAYADTVVEDTVVAFLFNPADYILNTNLSMTIKQYEDNDTEDKITKAVMLVDGKVVDKNSLVTLTKKSA